MGENLLKGKALPTGPVLREEVSPLGEGFQKICKEGGKKVRGKGKSVD